MWYLPLFFDWLYLVMIISGSIHVIANGIIPFFFMAEAYSIVCMYHIIFIHSSVDGRLGCFHVLTVVSSAAMNVRVHVSFWIIKTCIFLFEVFYYYWSVIDIQGCVSISVQWSESLCVHIHPPLLALPSSLPFYPSRSSQSTKLRFPCHTAGSPRHLCYAW